MHLQNFVPSRPNHAVGVYEIKAKPCMESAVGGMESSRSDEWNLVADEYGINPKETYTLTRDAIRLRRFHTALVAG